MKNRIFKNSIAALFMGIFFIKMVISIAPVFLCLDNKAVRAVIMQLEHESKNEKDDTDKDAFKDKKFFDENVNHLTVYRPLVVEINILHNQERSLYKQVFHPLVPTPPPNA
ncbi:MAG: hypothetical protein V4520_02210 [Bacteroidota bacterium]